MDTSNVQNLETISEGKQYIVISLGSKDAGSEQYGIDIQYVDNIVRLQRITRVPKAQPYFKGVINLRGEVIPVMSLRLKMGLEPDEYGNATRIIILKLEEQSAVGIIVDEVREVVTLPDEAIDQPSVSETEGNFDARNQYLSGVGKHEKGLISLLNIHNLLNEKDMV